MARVGGLLGKFIGGAGLVGVYVATGLIFGTLVGSILFGYPR